MENFKIKSLPLLICLVSMLYFQGCKKNENEEEVVQKEDVVQTEIPAETMDNNLATAVSDLFTTINWGTAQKQLIVTHEVHGEVVGNKLYIFGGYDINKRPKWSPTKHAYVYDPNANTWAPITDLPHTPNGPTFGGITHCGLTNDGKSIYFAGGYTSNADGTGQLFGTAQVWRYNITAKNYTRLPDLPQPLATGQLRYLNGKIHYMGGANLSRKDVDVHYALDLNNLSAGWKSLAPLINATNHPGSAVLNGKIYFMGGAHGQDESTVTQKTMEVYNETSNSWSRLADMPTAVDHISSAVITFKNRVLVLGGETSHNDLSDQVMAYNPATNTWAQLTHLPIGKSAGVAAILNDNVFYTGGNFANTNYKGVPVGTTTVPSQVTITPDADTYVRDGSFSSQNFGKLTTMVLKSTPVADFTRKLYLKFSLKNVSKVTSAKLRIYGRNTDGNATISISCYGVNSDSWAETGITFKNAPTNTNTVLSSAGVNSQAKYVEFDLTNYVKTQFAGDKNVSIMIKDPSNRDTNLTFNTKENSSNKPQLVIL